MLGEVDPNGTITASRKYDVYGAIRSGDSGTSAHKFVGALGHPSEDNTGLIYMQARYMDPVTGRFVSEDPAAHGVNWYVYASNAPTSKADKTGCDDFWIGYIVHLIDWLAGAIFVDGVSGLIRLIRICLQSRAKIAVQEAAELEGIAQIAGAIDPSDAAEVAIACAAKERLADAAVSDILCEQLATVEAILGDSLEWSVPND